MSRIVMARVTAKITGPAPSVSLADKPYRKFFPKETCCDYEVINGILLLLVNQTIKTLKGFQLQQGACHLCIVRDILAIRLFHWQNALVAARPHTY